MANLSTDIDWVVLRCASGKVIKVRKSVHPRARRLRLTVTPSGARITCPRGTRSTSIDAFVCANAEWLELKLTQMQRDTGHLLPLRVGRNDTMILSGRSVRLRWGQADYPHVEHQADVVRVLVPPPATRALAVAHGLLATFLEAHMRRDVARWLPLDVPRLGLAPTALRVRPLKTLWGSLDARNRIHLDLALALAPPAALHYVLAHELCHLKVRNHGPAFWREVDKLFPGWKAQRDWLREHGVGLKAELDRLVGNVAS